MGSFRTIAELLDLMQLSQRDMAFLLNRSQGLISRYETGHLPETAAIHGQLREISSLFEVGEGQEVTNPWVDPAALEQEAATWRQNEEKYMEVVLWRYRQRLMKMEKTYARSLRALHILGQIHENPNTPSNVYEWTRIVYPRLVQQVHTNAPVRQEKMRIAIKQLKARQHALSQP